HISFILFLNYSSRDAVYAPSLHDALPISRGNRLLRQHQRHAVLREGAGAAAMELARELVEDDDLRDAALGRRAPAERFTLRDLLDRKSTRLNSSHVKISYAVFCLKKKNKS